GLRSRWEALKSSAPKLTVEASRKLHDELFDALKEIDEQALERTNMRLVDSLHIYYMGEVASRQILEAEQSIGHLVALLSSVTIAKQVSPEHRGQITTETHNMQMLV